MSRKYPNHLFFKLFERYRPSKRLIQLFSIKDVKIRQTNSKNSSAVSQDVEDSVREDMAKLRASSLISDDVVINGAVYDVDTGKMTQVME